MLHWCCFVSLCVVFCALCFSYVVFCILYFVLCFSPYDVAVRVVYVVIVVCCVCVFCVSGLWLGSARLGLAWLGSTYSSFGLT